jgi:hypothetical protein
MTGEAEYRSSSAGHAGPAARLSTACQFAIRQQLPSCSPTRPLLERGSGCLNRSHVAVQRHCRRRGWGYGFGRPRSSPDDQQNGSVPRGAFVDRPRATAFSSFAAEPAETDPFQTQYLSREHCVKPVERVTEASSILHGGSLVFDGR